MKNALLLLAAALLFIANACQKNDPDSNPNTQAEETQRMREYLAETYGFALENIEETPEAFIAEGDQLFAKENFWEEQTAHPANEFFLKATFGDDAASDRKQRRHSYLVSYNYWHIKVNIKSEVTQAWRDAILEAIDEWNNTGGFFYFEATYLNYSVNNSINIDMNANLAAKTVASTYLPTSSAKPGSPMYINPAHNGQPHSKKVFAMVHEIGHAVGFRHTDTFEGYSISAASAYCNNNADSGSVMKPTVNYWNGFTSCDLDAYWVLYPW